MHLQAHRLVDRTRVLKRLDQETDLFAPFPDTTAHADHVKTGGSPTGGGRHPSQRQGDPAVAGLSLKRKSRRSSDYSATTSMSDFGD